MPGQRFYGLFDQAGMLSPLAGSQAATLRALPGVKLNRGSDDREHALFASLTDQGFGGKDIGGFGGNVGYLNPRGVADVPLANAPGYFGLAPASIQPGIDKPNPWSDPTAGSGGA